MTDNSIFFCNIADVQCVHERFSIRCLRCTTTKRPKTDDINSSKIYIKLPCGVY